ncbi:craniofacial development protein 2 [Trichonephila clavipes]|nr:craniofacial development protein 2 [Trichonephila clavipes]
MMGRRRFVGMVLVLLVLCIDVELAMEVHAISIAKTGSNIPRRLGMKKDLSIGAWNIRTLYKGAALQNLIDVFVHYHVDVLAIQEIRWLGTGILDKKDCTLYYSCQEKAHHFGVGFI